MPPNHAGEPGSEFQGNWDARLMTMVTEINDQLLAAICRTAAGHGPPLATPLVPALRPQWLALGGERRRMLAACPYLLIDAGFADPARWLLPSAGVADGPRAASFIGSLDVALWRQVLTLAWHLARANPLLARMALEMCSQGCRFLQAASLAELEHWVDRRPLWVRPRWEDRPEVWRQLLQAALADQPELLQQLQLRGIQLLAGAMTG